MPLAEYATEQDLANWLTVSNPDNAVSLLRSAMIRVARACNLDPYQTPDPSITDPLRDATCAQVASWVALGIDPAKSGTDMPGPVKSATLLDKKIDRDTTSASKLLESAVTDLCDEAQSILHSAGLLLGGPLEPVPVGADPTDMLPDWGTGTRSVSPLRDPLSGEYAWPNFDGWPWYE